MRDASVTHVGLAPLDGAGDELLGFAVIVGRCRGRWVLCRHRARDTWEIPGGHREAGEDILATARRELLEETGALDYTLEPVCVYSVTQDDADRPGGSLTTHGLLCFAQIHTLGPLPPSEIEEVCLVDTLPGAAALTYPRIQPLLLARVEEWLAARE